MLYLRLFHGRTDPSQDMDGWGTDGPVFGPHEFVHTTYVTTVKLGNPDGNCGELFMYEDMLYYDGVYYGDWTVFTDETLKKSKFATTPFDQSKSNLPAQPS